MSLCEYCKYKSTCKEKRDDKRLCNAFNDNEEKEAEAEAYREAMRLDDEEDTLAYKFGFGGLA